MEIRDAIAIGFVCAATLLDAGMAHAETTRPPSSPWIVKPPRPPPDLNLPTVGLHDLRATSEPRLFLRDVAAPRTHEIRLSQGAKTAIIVTAIVVGALIIVGVIAVGHPGHPF